MKFMDKVKMGIEMRKVFLTLEISADDVAHAISLLAEALILLDSMKQHVAAAHIEHALNVLSVRSDSPVDRHV